jgi:Rne/Rng family ribonuclease
MSKELIVNSTSLETKLAIVEDDLITEIFIERHKNKGILGNIYKGKVTKVLPGMQAAFVDIGLERHAFLYVSDFTEDFEEYEELFRTSESAEIDELLRAEPKAETRVERGERPERPVKPERAERQERQAKAEKPERAEAPEKAEKAERPQRQEKPERPERPERPSVSADEKRSRRNRRGRREQGRPGRGKDRFEEAPAPIGEDHHIEPLPGESFAHRLELPQLPTVAASEAGQPGSIAVWDPMFEDLARKTSQSVEPPTQPELEHVSPPDQPLPETNAVEPPTPATRQDEPAAFEAREELRPEGPSPTPDSQTGAYADVPDAQASVEDKGDRLALAVRGGAGRKRRTAPRSNARAQIGDLLREGQEILVQVAKEPIGKKGARITSHVALPGRYLVFMPTVDHIGVSRKISTEAERLRLKEIISRLRGDFGKGFIIRTAGENHSEEDLRADMVYLTKTWEELRAKMDKLSAPALVHSEPSLVQRVVRDYFNDGYRAIRVDDEHEYERIVDFVSKFSPELVNRVRLYNKNTPIFEQYGIAAEIEKALRQKVWLKNGGYIVINQTEALVAIDVNTGKFVGSTNSLEDTITRTNLDAVKEVVRQIRLRDLGGIIVIDFIDMDERRNRQKVMEALQQELSKDKSPSKILQFNEFGLVAITRKRVKQSLERTLCQPCLFCNGTGMTKSIRTICYSIHQEVRKLLPHLGEGDELIIRCHPDVAKGLRNGEREVLTDIEEMSRKIVTIKPDPLMHIEQFDVVEG